MEATYHDGLGDGRKAEFVSPNKVQGKLQNDNTGPKLTAGTVASRRVDEELAGANAGGPVAGTDADGDVLTYQLSGADAPATSPRFSINRATGQITTTGALDYENAC